MSEMNDEFRLVWMSVCYRRDPFTFKTHNPITSKLLKQRGRKSTYHQSSKQMNKNLISTKNSTKMLTMFHRRNDDYVEKSSKRSASANTEKSNSIPSFSSYGMLSGTDRSSSRKITDSSVKHHAKPMINLPLAKFHGLSPIIMQDLERKPSAIDILEGFVKEKLLHGKLEMEANERFNITKMYEKCITNSIVLNRFLSKDFSFLPDYIKEVVINSMEIRVSIAIKKDSVDAMSLTLLNQTQELIESFRVATQHDTQGPKNDVSNAIIKDNNDFKRFFHPILLAKTFSTRVDEDLVHTRDKHAINEIVDNLTSKLFTDSDLPDSDARINVLTVLKSSKLNMMLLKELSLQIDMWYDALLNGLFSKYRTVVEDTCIVISYICFQPILAQTMINNCLFDVGRDTTAAILRAMEMKPMWLSIYSFALGFVIGCCQRFSILEVIFEKIHDTKQYDLLECWPNFIFYASQFWKSQCLNLRYGTVHNIVNLLEFCFLKKLSKAPAKRALILYCKRCSVQCKSVTIWPGKE